MEIQNPVFFKSVKELRKWFQKNHNKASELWIGFYNVKSGKDGASYKQAVDEALCFGWIDGIRKNINEESYVNRFTPRKKSSIWSNINTKRIKELIEENRVHSSGLEAFNKRVEAKAGVYSFEQESHKLSPVFEKKIRANKKAWKYFCLNGTMVPTNLNTLGNERKTGSNTVKKTGGPDQ